MFKKLSLVSIYFDKPSLKDLQVKKLFKTTYLLINHSNFMAKFYLMFKNVKRE